MTARLLIICTTLLALYGCQVDQAGFGSDNNNSSSVTLGWWPPTERQNGDPIELDDIGGYEIRFRNQNSNDYTTIVINDPDPKTYSFGNLKNANQLIFEVAVFDTNGIYSEFVVAQGS